MLGRENTHEAPANKVRGRRSRQDKITESSARISGSNVAVRTKQENIKRNVKKKEKR